MARRYGQRPSALVGLTASEDEAVAMGLDIMVLGAGLDAEARAVRDLASREGGMIFPAIIVGGA